MNKNSILLLLVVFTAIISIHTSSCELNERGNTKNLQEVLKDHRIDQELQDLIESGNDRFYKVYRQGREADYKDGSIRYWRGLLILPDLTKKSALINLKADRNDPDNWWYLNSDDSFSRYIRATPDNIIGLINVDRDGNLFLAYDLDGDRILDVIYTNSAEAGKVLIAEEHYAEKLSDTSWRLRDSPCGSDTGAVSGAAVELDGMGVFDICAQGYEGGPEGGSNEETGLGGLGLLPGSPGSVPDLIGTLCSGFESGSGPDINPGITSDDTYTERYINYMRDLVDKGFDGQRDSLPVSVGRVLFWWFAPGVDSAVKMGLVIAAVLDIINANKEGSGADTTPDADNTGNPGDNAEPEDPDREEEDDTGEQGQEGEGGGSGEPVGGETTQPGCISGTPDCDRGNEALRELCEILNSDDDFLDSVEDLENRNAADTNCDDPVINPDSAEASETAEIDCYPGKGRGTDTNSVEDVLTIGNSGDDCGPTETPGPEGECNGLGATFSWGAGKGSYWIAFSEVIGIDFCNDFICDDFQ